MADTNVPFGDLYQQATEALMNARADIVKQRQLVETRTAEKAAAETALTAAQGAVAAATTGVAAAQEGVPTRMAETVSAARSLRGILDDYIEANAQPQG